MSYIQSGTNQKVAEPAKVLPGLSGRVALKDNTETQYFVTSCSRKNQRYKSKHTCDLSI